MVAQVILIALLLVSAITDVRQNKIFNWTTYPGILIALLLNAFAALWGEESASTVPWLGAVGLSQSLGGLLACGGLMLVCFVFFRIGGGDVKLMAMIGAYLGVELGIEALLWTFVLAAGLGLIILVWRVGAWRLLSRVARQVLYSLRIGGWSALDASERGQLQFGLFLAPAAIAAVLMVWFVPWKSW